jgi:hypothetical protein
MIKNFAAEFTRYRAIGEKAIEQVSDEALNRVPGPDNNSIAMIVRHISGNLISRFTDFLTTDGEKEWRDRDSEFGDVRYASQEVDQMWARGWAVLESQLAALKDEDLKKVVFIRGNPLTVHKALCRSLAHTASHVGQIVLLAKVLSSESWKSLSIPKERSHEYNQNATLEKSPE